MSVRIAAVVPVGYLDRMGYQHTWPVCRDNLLDAVDDHVFVDSVRRPPLDGRGLWISGPETWFARQPNGSYWFDAHRVMENVNVGVGCAGAMNCDAALVLMCNNYIPDADLIYNAAEAMLEADEPFAYYYRMDQLAGKMFGPSVRLPWLVNLRHRADLRFSVDCLVVDGEIVGMERGDYSLDAGPLVVDVQLEMTVGDLAEKMNFIRCYSDLVPKRRRVFEWGYWFRYYVDKFRRKRAVGVMTPTGVVIASNSQPDFVSHAVLEAL